VGGRRNDTNFTWWGRAGGTKKCRKNVSYYLNGPFGQLMARREGYND